MKTENNDIKEQAIAAVSNMRKKAADMGYMSDEEINAEIKAARRDTIDQKEDLATAERLLREEHARLAGAKGYTVDEFEKNMKNAIAEGAKA